MDGQDKVLNEDDLSDVYDILRSVREQWWQVGLQLRVISAELDAMRRSSRTQDPLMRMLRHWLRNSPHPTWPDIVEALRSVNRPNEAERVRRSYCAWYEPQQSSFVESELACKVSYAHTSARSSVWICK